ncbi:MAG: transglycosylase SLT domain-containing protein [Bacteroidales bacterium]|nr:transglycosylase SLT domain-containing protein [Bacteroidales bacterium]
MMRLLAEKTKTRLRYLTVSVMIICITPLCEKGRMLNGAHSSNVFAGKDITCAIDLGDDMYGSHGLETGFNYELLGRFSKDNHCNVRIIAAGKNEDYIDSLLNGKVDIVITHEVDSLDQDGINILKKMMGCSVWAIKDAGQNKTRQLDNWISYMLNSDDFKEMHNRYSKSYNPHRMAEKGIRTDMASPYDQLIRKYAADLGWDWRMLAAVLYQESRFSINSRSSRGAQGLMQVMPQTGLYYGIDDLLDPEKNLKAGTSHLLRLQKIFAKYDLQKDELIKFTLAAYNAGEGRVADCRNFASAIGVDNTNWDEITKIIPLMREDAILEEESVRLGKFQGHETIAYVENVMSHYQAICSICPVI